jgi:hypothetical protein
MSDAVSADVYDLIYVCRLHEHISVYIIPFTLLLSSELVTRVTKCYSEIYHWWGYINAVVSLEEKLPD